MDRLRWLLRLVGDDSLIEFCLEGGPSDLTLNELELRFFGLSPDAQHPPAEQRPAWNMLDDGLDVPVEAQRGRQPVAWLRLCQIIGELVRAHASHEQQSELARKWASPEFLGLTALDPSKRVEGYYELHLHFRGAVSFDYSWEQLMTHARARAALRGHSLEFPTRTLTRAELLSRAYALDCLRPLTRRQDMQYTVLKLNFRRFVLHQRGRTGLVSFSQSYDRYAKILKSTSNDAVKRDREAAAQVFEHFERLGATAIELRPTLDQTRRGIQRKLRTLIEGYFCYLGSRKRDDRPLTLGLVPSLFKQELTIRHGDHHGHTNDHDLQDRLDTQLGMWVRQVDSLLAIIDECPVLRLFIVGLDAAGIEHGAPIRDLAPAFARVHRYHEKWGLSARVPGRSLWRELSPMLEHEGDASCCATWERVNDNGHASISRCRLGLTVHVGEDFVDPMTGLREIWEAVTHLGLQDGDRIGHGIAASLVDQQLEKLLNARVEDPSYAALQHSQHKGGPMRLRKPLGLHALDLAWAQECLVPTHRTALQLALGRAFGVSPLHRATLRSLREGASSLATIPGVHFFDADTLEPEQQCWVALDDQWFADFETLRAKVVALLVRKGIVVESCPTSNQAVATLDRAPLFDFLEFEGLRCAVATDDPGVLEAWPADELARLSADQRKRVLRTNARASFIRP